MTGTIDGNSLRKWLLSPDGKADWIVGYRIDDGSHEWVITGIQNQSLLLAELDADGITRSGKTKVLPIVRIGNDICLWSESDDQRAFDAIESSRSPLDIAAQDALTYLANAGWSDTNKLGLSAIELASLVRRVGDPLLSTVEIERIASISQVSKDSSRAAAKWINKHLEKQPEMDLKTKMQAKVQISSLLRAAGRYDEALAATEGIDNLSTHDIPAMLLVVLLVTRSAAIMDRYEHNPTNDQATEWMNLAERMLKKAYAISGGRPTEHQNAAFGRLRALQNRATK